MIGRKVKLDFSKVTPDQFEARRAEYHRALQEAFFTQFRIKGTSDHVIKRGESVWVLAQQRYNIPIWLLRQYNPDLDLGSLLPGARLVIPLVEATGASRSRRREQSSSVHVLLGCRCAGCGGCMSAQLYDGPKRDRDEVARITGDPVFTAGSPITVVLRQVDDRDIGIDPDVGRGAGRQRTTCWWTAGSPKPRAFPAMRSKSKCMAAATTACGRKPGPGFGSAPASRLEAVD